MIFLIGVDGIGKSTLMDELEQQGHKVLRCPQFYNSTDAQRNISNKFLYLSRYFEEISQKADQHQRYDVKAWALFYGMSLYRKVISDHYDFGERYPFFEASLYEPIYQSLLAKNPAPFDLQVTDKVKNYLNEVCGSDDITMSFQFIYNELPKIKEILFPRFPYDKIVLLKAQQETILKRLQQKNKDKHGEFHEKAHLLMQIQNGYEKFLATVPENQKTIIHVDEMSVKELGQTLFPQFQI